MSIKKEMLDSITTKDKGKAAILPFSTLLLTEPCSQLLQPHQPLWVWANGTDIDPGKSNLHVGAGRGIQAGIKGKISNLKKGGGQLVLPTMVFLREEE